jgi:hypothetical protein
MAGCKDVKGEDFDPCKKPSTSQNPPKRPTPSPGDVPDPPPSTSQNPPKRIAAAKGPFDVQ